MSNWSSLDAPEYSPASLDLVWGLHEQVAAAFFPSLRELQASVAQAAAPIALVDANEPARFQRASMMGMAAVTDLALDISLAEPVRAALRDLPTHYQELLNVLQPAAQAITAASPDLRNIQQFEGMTGLLHGAAQAANPSTPIGVAAIGGATLGTLLLPGIGTALGGAIGVWLGGAQVSKRDRLAIQRFAAATKLMAAAVDDLHRALWNQLARSVLSRQGPILPDAAYFETAGVRWEKLKAELPATIGAEEMGTVRSKLDVYFDKWGPHPEALYVACRLCLPPYPLDLDFLTALNRRQRELYPKHPGTHEIAARLALEKADFRAALEAAERGLEIDPRLAGLREVQLEALAALRRLPEAEEAARLARTDRRVGFPEQVLVRGLMRGEHRLEAVERVRAWAQRDGKPAAIVRQLKASAPTAILLADGAVPIPELVAVPPGLEGEIQAIVEEHLHADDAKSYRGALPEEKARNAAEAFLHLQPGERLLYFCDWSLWHNAKTGLAITDRRLMWKSAWQDPVILEWRQAVGRDVATNQTTLRIGSISVDVEDEPQAAALALAIRQILQAFANSAMEKTSAVNARSFAG